jgi:membrane-bound lytic murein transglycosylase D
MIEKILLRYGVPREFYYLSAIESGFVDVAVSRASAVGIWQLVRSTARRYGLTCNTYVDERRDVLRSTQAAAKYLRDLFERFGSWPLVVAAYNAGGGRIERVIRREGSNDFWELAERRVLPLETIELVPKFMALALIARDPARYGFENIANVGKELDVVQVTVPPLIGVERIAAEAGLSVSEVRRLNPQLIRGITPPRPRGKGWPVWVPKSTVPRLMRLWPRVALQLENKSVATS